MAKFKFVIVSKDQEKMFSLEDLTKKGLEYTVIYGNTRKLTTVYNEELRQERANKIHDFIVFIHADVRFNVEHFMKHCEECSDKYDIMGLCGCAKVATSQSPLNWFTASNPFPQFRWGCVTHGELGNSKSFFSGDRAEIRDHAVGMIDGLCIVFGRNAIDSDIIFDERFSFDQYDSDISFEALLNKKLRLGVIVEESLQHYSVGKSILNDDFLRHEMDFRKKWNLEIPKGSRLEQLINLTN